MGDTDVHGFLSAFLDDKTGRILVLNRRARLSDTDTPMPHEGGSNANEYIDSEGDAPAEPESLANPRLPCRRGAFCGSAGASRWDGEKMAI